MLLGECNVHGATIANTHGFQGDERDIMLLSVVRSNPNNKIGFAKNPHRMNVALTRARLATVIIGNAITLRDGDEESHWRKCLQDIPILDRYLRHLQFEDLSPPEFSAATTSKSKLRMPEMNITRAHWCQLWDIKTEVRITTL